MSCTEASLETRIVKEYKVGKMNWDGKVVQACSDKGLLQIVGVKGDTGLKEEFRVRWYNIGSGALENVVQINGNIRFEKVEGSKSNNVFVLKSNNVSKHVYWIQDSKLQIDDLLSELNNEVARLSSLYEKIDSLMGRFSTSNLGLGANTGANANPNSGHGYDGLYRNNSLRKLQLSSVLGRDVIAELIQDSELINELKDHMPEGQRTYGDVISAINCPQVKYTLRLLDETIYSSQLFALAAALGLDINHGMFASPDSNPMAVFISALDDKYNEKNEELKRS
ncbi:hypothetical protein FG386_003449 [Cryptosporidium ryanae]|uniref:uncharacterized protein n=1 Tax=Cryptosporidium ryanae TaxID=515981 RepID=UPI00351A3A33|nr:hypothetical protein FG386_003449 [Cryptosporidium ryanae]